MLTAMTEEDWTIVLRVFAASRSRRGDKGRNDRKFLEALHYFVVHNITWRALPEKFGHWNSVWKRFWRLSRSGTFEAFFDALAAMSETAHLVQMFDSLWLIPKAQTTSITHQIGAVRVHKDPKPTTTQAPTSNPTLSR